MACWPRPEVAVSRGDRRLERRSRAEGFFAPESIDAVLDLFEVMELAWHDLYGDVAPPEDLLDDVMLLSEGRLDRLVATVRLALADWRDVRVAASERRSQ